MTDPKITQQIKEFLDTPEEERDYAAGNTLLLQISGNRIRYRNLSVNPQKYAEHINYNLQKQYNFRIQSITHEEVNEMQKEADKIVEEHGLDREKFEPEQSFKKGKRDDHDKLPEEIKACYVENLSITRRMREVHLQLRHLSTIPNICPDSDRYPYLKELVQLDKQLHKNWDIYDHYTGQTGEKAAVADARVASRKSNGSLNLRLSRYEKNPTEEGKAKIMAEYAKILNPSEKLNAKMKALNLL